MEMSIRDVSKTMSGREVLSGVSFDVGSGECVGLVGPNGAGKTTLIRSILGLYAVDGIILFDGAESKDVDFLEKKVFFMLDNYGLFKELDVHDNIEFFFRAYNGPRIDRKEMEGSIQAILADLRLSEHSDKMVKALSKGMKQRLSLGRTMVSDPRLMILDEPFSSLDVEGQLFLSDHLERLKAGGTTILVSSHDLGHLQRICDSVVFIDRGKVREKIRCTESEDLTARYIDIMMGNGHERVRQVISGPHPRVHTEAVSPRHAGLCGDPIGRGGPHRRPRIHHARADSPHPVPVPEAHAAEGAIGGRCGPRMPVR